MPITIPAGPHSIPHRGQTHFQGESRPSAGGGRRVRTRTHTHTLTFTNALDVIVPDALYLFRFLHYCAANGIVNPTAGNVADFHAAHGETGFEATGLRSITLVGRNTQVQDTDEAE